MIRCLSASVSFVAFLLSTACEKPGASRASHDSTTPDTNAASAAEPLR